jgi:hypothetical protein
VIGEFLGAIIDNHDETANVEALKEKIVDIFIMRRETMFHKFLDCRAGNPSGETVDKRFVEKLRADYMRASAVNEELLNQNKELTNNLAVVRQNAEAVVNKFKTLKMRYEATVQELAICKQKNIKLEESLRANPVVSNILPLSMEEDDDEESYLLQDEPISPVKSTPRKEPPKLSKLTASYETPGIAGISNTVGSQGGGVSNTTVGSSTTTGSSTVHPVQHTAEAKKEPQKSTVSNTTTSSNPKPSNPIARGKPAAVHSTPEPKKAEIKIPVVKDAFKKEEPVPDNELDAAIAKTVDLGKAPSISDIY